MSEAEPLDASPRPVDASAPPADASFQPVDGWRAWIVVLGSFLVHFTSLGAVYSAPVYFETYKTRDGVTTAQASLLLSTMLGLTFVAGTFSGRLADKFGIRPIVAVGAFLFVVGHLCASWSDSFSVTVVLQGAVTGLGVALTYWPAVSTLPQWFEKRLGVASGLSVFGAGAGQLCWAVFLEQSLARYGLEVTLRIHGLSGGALLLCALACLDRRLPAQPHGSVFRDVGSLWRTQRNYRLLIIASAFFQFGYSVPLAHLVGYSLSLGLDATQAAAILGIMGLGSALGRIVLGFFADVLGRLLSFKLAIAATAVVLAFLPLCETRASLAAISAMLGFFSGGFIAMVPIVGKQLFGAARLGSVFSLLNLVMVFGVFVAPATSGKWIDSSKSYDLPFWILSATPMCVAAILLGMMSSSEAVDLVDMQQRVAVKA